MGNLTIKPASGGLLKLQDAGSTDRIQITDGGSTVLYEDDGNAALTIDTSGNATIETGNLVIGTAGKGIMFYPHDETVTGPPGSDSNLLSDYEEGTFTATLADSSENTVASTSVTGQYVKIGRCVTIHFGKSNLSTSGLTSTDVFRVNGLPFSSNTMAAGNQGWVGVASTARIPWTADSAVHATPYVVTGQDYVQFWKSGMDSYTGNIKVNELNSGGSDYQVFITYITT